MTVAPSGTSSSSSTNTAPERAQPLDHVAVVHDFVTHVDRRAEQLDRTLDDVDGAIDAGTEAARIGEQDLHVRSATVLRRARLAAGIEQQQPAPMVMAESATLNAGKYALPQCTWMKSTTCPSTHAVDHVAERAAENQRQPAGEQAVVRALEPPQPHDERR